MDNSTPTTNNSGSLKISKEVVESIAKYTVAEMNGVSLAPKALMTTGWFLEKRTVRPVSIEINDGIAAIDVRILLDSGANIPDISKQIQSAIKESVQNMTGIVVEKVNLHVAGLTFQENQAAV